jgi:3-phenylpropionate/cinnamic acid dioxygenase small subunit
MSLPLTLRFEVEDVLHAYAAVLDAADLEQWPEFFTDECFYEVIPRDNYERGLPLALIRCESKGMLKDRVVAIRDTMMYEPRYLRHLLSGIRVITHSAHDIAMEANYAVFETLVDAPTRVFNVGRYLGRLRRQGEHLKFAELHCVFDSLLVPNSLIYPI